ncbi:transcription initiation factor TFIID subunit 15-like [Pollicipes pollicipes]|uniref:transcription initiation factor TFIID subunit 15-like n=1 Tax=Pollicipes pollicipes TaxID=41117 RepID=UPI00188597CE|nr:transcription initiation factor TFIID subunit 15-like [Pollicipes pollicipes]
MPPESSTEEVANFFGSIGRIKLDKRTGLPRIWMYKDKMTGSNKGECTVTYDDVEAAKSAIDWFSGKDFRGNTIKVSMAERRAAGDWKCPNDDCGNVNFAWRHECNRCQTGRDGGPMRHDYGGRDRDRPY